jgi:excisionase family DNA binding protein
MSRWLTLSAASKLLGAHPATLRQWADAGKVPSYRTPGGHRRFLDKDIRNFLVQAGHSDTPPDIDIEESLFNTALVETRRDLQQSPPSEQLWYSQFDEEGMANQRVLGRSLFEKAIRYLTLPGQREALLHQGRELGSAYAFSSLKYQISLLDTVRAFQFFRQKLLRSLTSPDSGTRLTDQEDLNLRENFDAFFDEVLFGLIDTYERQLLGEKGTPETLPPVIDG